jgi:subtilisin family serine protease
MKKWNVDIISMSFGFAEDIQSIREAIIEAEKQKVIFFAAANNGGWNAPELFPALMESVFSVRGTRYNGAFDDDYNPRSWDHKPGPQFGSLACDVPCAWTSNDLTKSGCSVAAPIVAATAALVMTFVEREASLSEYRDLIRTRRGILSVFKAMATETKPSRLYLAPWQLFENNRKPRVLIENALTNIPRLS